MMEIFHSLGAEDGSTAVGVGEGIGITESSRISFTSDRDAKRRISVSFAVTPKPLKIQKDLTRSTAPEASCFFKYFSRGP